MFKCHGCPAVKQLLSDLNNIHDTSSEAQISLCETCYGPDDANCVICGMPAGASGGTVCSNECRISIIKKDTDNA